MNGGWDWIVVGAGSAGAVLAGRLSEDPGLRVLLVEAGDGRRPLAMRIPAAFSTLFRTAHDWAFETEPEPRLGGRRLFWPRGKAVGGSSAMNAMIWTHGHPADFDAWRSQGAQDWGWSDVAPWFQRVAVRTSRPTQPGIVAGAFIEALAGLGLPRRDGFNSGPLDGVGLFDVTVFRGERDSSARAYLDPARPRGNLRVLTGAVVQRIIVEGDRAAGIEVRTGASTVEPVHARRGVILAAGAIGSPALLLRSGLGPAPDLARHGIPVVRDLPGVGANLSDHLACGIAHHCLQPVTLEAATGPLPLLRWLAFRSGPLTSNCAEAGAFLRWDPGSPAPDLELLIAPVWFVDHGFRRFPGHGFTLAAVGLRPWSRGRVRLRAPSADAPPVITPNYLDDERDLAVLVEGIRWCRRAVAHPAFARLRGAEALPGPGTIDDAEVEAHVRREAQTLYHPAGTCRMGQDDGAVVDPTLRVRGIDRLWVADASVLPTLVSAHPNAAVVVIAERLAAGLASGGQQLPVAR